MPPAARDRGGRARRGARHGRGPDATVGGAGADGGEREPRARNAAAEDLYHEADVAFHRAVITATGNRPLRQMTRPSSGRSRRPAVRSRGPACARSAACPSTARS